MRGESNDIELLRAWQRGDRRAGTELFRRHFPSVYVFFRNKVNEGIDDLVQQTFLGCLESAQESERIRSFRAYLFGIARNQLLRRFASSDARKLEQLARVAVVEVTGPSGIFARHEEQRVLLTALRRLPLDMQITIELFYWEHMSLLDVADVLGIPEGTVKSRLHRAKQLLRAEVERCDAGEAVLRTTIANLDDWARSVRSVVAERIPR